MQFWIPFCSKVMRCIAARHLHKQYLSDWNQNCRTLRNTVELFNFMFRFPEEIQIFVDLTKNLHTIVIDIFNFQNANFALSFQTHIRLRNFAIALLNVAVQIHLETVDLKFQYTKRKKATKRRTSHSLMSQIPYVVYSHIYVVYTNLQSINIIQNIKCDYCIDFIKQ